MAAIPGSVRFTGFIAPTDSTDTYPVTDPTWGLGGLRRVSGTTERDLISTGRREAGMLVFSEGDDTYYKLGSGLTNSDWTAFLTGSTGGGTSADLWSASTGTNSIIANNGTGNVAEGNFTIVAGFSNIASSSGHFSSILGGSGNYTRGIRSSVVNGISNSATTTYGVVINGQYNLASDNPFSFIGNGRFNTASGRYSFIGNGKYHTASGDYSLIAGGRYNTASTNNALIVGGYNNLASGSNSFVGGGRFNIASNTRSVVVGGSGNESTGSQSFIGGGSGNVSSNVVSSVVGGSINSATTAYSFVGGGRRNLASASHSIVVGGRDNTASGTHSGILNGSGNTVSGSYSAVIGGQSLSNPYSNTVMMPNVYASIDFSGGTNGGVIYSGGTDLYDIFATAGSGGNETLAQTLALGNITDGNDIVLSTGDTITSISGTSKLDLRRDGVDGHFRLSGDGVEIEGAGNTFNVDAGVFGDAHQANDRWRRYYSNYIKCSLYTKCNACRKQWGYLLSWYRPL